MNKTEKAFINYAKKWLSCDLGSDLKLDSCEGLMEARVISLSDDEILKIKFYKDKELFAFYEYNHVTNKWKKQKVLKEVFGE